MLPPGIYKIIGYYFDFFLFLLFRTMKIGKDKKAGKRE